MRSLDADVPVYQLKPLDEEITEAVSGDRTMAVLCSAFGVLAILLTAIGIYGVMSYSVARRRRKTATPIIAVAMGM